jgi:transcription-repair coupling factor (superfamily II helicase)
VSGVPAGAVALLSAWLNRKLARATLLIAEDAERAYMDVTAWIGEDNVGLFADVDVPPFDSVPPGEEVTRRRIAALTLLAGGKPALLVASPKAIMHPTLSPDVLRSSSFILQRSTDFDRDETIRRLSGLGYRRATAVSSPGDFAVRGGIVDVFLLTERHPVRVEWFGNEVDDIRLFDVESQTAIDKQDSVEIGPARELDLSPGNIARAVRDIDALDLDKSRPEIGDTWRANRDLLSTEGYVDGIDVFTPYLTAGGSTLLDHCAGAVVICAGGKDRLLRQAKRYEEEIAGVLDQEVARGELPGGASSGLVPADQLIAALDGALEMVRDVETASVDLGWTASPTYTARFAAFASHASSAGRQSQTVVAITHQQRRIEDLIAESGGSSVDAVAFNAAQTELESGLMVVDGDLSSGFLAPEANLEVVTDAELFGGRRRRGSPLARSGRKVLSTSSRGSRQAASGKAAAKAFTLPFAPGDLVVHRDHGIGRFIEMRKQLDSGAEHEYMTLEYADGNRLYVPVAHLDRVDRYVGGGDSTPMLSKLGTGEWERTKRRVKERAEAVARELLGLYSRREMSPGTAYAPDGVWMNELEASFPYEETLDQSVVIDEIKRDMEASKPMDRVVCGDVGFGKTEIAIRAAFKAACDGKQVAVLVPTTVLSQQHYLTFTDRLSAFPVKVAQLSRFCTDEDIRRTIVELRTGGVDIVVGTHRLLQRDVTFKNLGLVIIDEEQRFGVMQKEKFKELRAGVDVLSLSATPIPRTLHMSLAGIRDLSVIQSPPEARQPIKTYVTAKDPALIREVIARELVRGGQVFYVHNRVRSIEHEADQVRALVPDARVAVGHGQMDEQLLASVMRKFSEGEIDVLICTTIVESGLDIPNANTIIINDAHRFGLAQLYQLRGRVGRSTHRAYAYILYPAERSLTEKADKRLEVIGELQDLGAGFTLAMRDLEIRGAGNLLGEEQHGEIAAVGLEMYNHLLSQAVSTLQGKPLLESPAQVTVSLPVAASLPPGYVSDERLRLRCYQDLAGCTTERELEAAADGLRDRFGPLPPEADGLIFSLRIRLLAAAGGANAVEANDRGGVSIQLPVSHQVDLEAINRQFPSWLSRSPSRLYVAPPTGDTKEWEDVLTRTLRELGRLTRQTEREPARA